jgi:hypothetical protein
MEYPVCQNGPIWDRLHLRLLRAHGVIKKISKTHRYQLTDHGRTLVTAMTSALAASTAQLTKIAA